MTEDRARVAYELRLRRRESEALALDRRDRRLGNARLACFAVGVALAWPTLATQTWHPAWLLLPLVAFLVLVALHGRVSGALERSRLACEHYRRGLSRLAGEWRDVLDDGSRFLDQRHPYAEDLDVVGAGSLYGLLCTARSLPGRETLADWLLAPSDPAGVATRHEAVRELRERLDLQEDLAVMAARLSPRLRADDLDSWGSAARRLRSAAWPWLAAVLAVVNLTALLAWILGPLEGRMVLVAFAVSGGLVLPLRRRVRQVLTGLAMPAGELRFLGGMLARLESESFSSARLGAFQRTVLESEGGESPARPSDALAELVRWIEWNDSRRNQIFQPISALLLFGTQLAFGVERWRSRHGPAVGSWLRAIGEVEALSALATFSFENPDFVFPELITGRPCFEAYGVVHPLLPRSGRVPNDVRLAGPPAAVEGSSESAGDSAPQLLLVSGSNMSGKSTLLRTVGVAAVLAYAGAPVPAERLKLSPLAIGASLEVHDSLLEGVSRFYAELRKLSRIRELAAAGPTLFLLDEILHGTNSHDRRLGAAGVLRGLLDDGALGLVTTHDLALAEVVDQLGPRAANVHFEDHLDGERMAFDYRLRPGVVRRGNALALMKSLGLPVAPE